MHSGFAAALGFVLAGAGLTEVKTYPFVGQADFDRLGLHAYDPLRTTVAIANPLSAERPALTTTLLPALLETAARNASRGQPRLGDLRDGSCVPPDD